MHVFLTTMHDETAHRDALRTSTHRHIAAHDSIEVHVSWQSAEFVGCECQERDFLSVSLW